MLFGNLADLFEQFRLIGGDKMRIVEHRGDFHTQKDKSLYSFDCAFSIFAHEYETAALVSDNQDFEVIVAEVF